MDRDYYMSPTAVCLKDGLLWTIQVADNKFMALELDTQLIVESYEIKNRNIQNRRFYSDRIIDAGDKLIIFLDILNEIFCYDFERKEVYEMTSLPGGKKYRDNYVTMYNDKLYVFPDVDKTIMIFDLGEKTWEEKEIFKENITFSKYVTKENNTLIATYRGKNTLCFFDLDTLEYTEKTFGNIEDNYFGPILCENTLVILSEQNERVVLVNRDTEVIDYINEFPNNYKYIPNWGYLEMYAYNEYIYIIPKDANMLLKINVAKKKIDRVFSDVEFSNYDINTGEVKVQEYNVVAKKEKNVYAFSFGEDIWRKFDLETETSEKLPIYRPANDDIGKNLNQLFNEETVHYVINEDKRNKSLKSFISTIYNM